LDLEAEIRTATDAARTAGRLLREYFEKGEVTTRSKAVRQDVVTQADLESEAAIVGQLQDAWPEDGFLAEESGRSVGSSSRVWCVDPLDGTANFAAGYPHWSVAIALLEQEVPVLAVTFDPLRDEIFVAQENKQPTLPADAAGIRALTRVEDALVADNRPYEHREPEHRLEMLFRRSRGRRESGSMALDFAWLAAGRLDVMSYERSERLWDYIGGELMATEAGAEVRIADQDFNVAVAACPELTEFLCAPGDE